MSGALPLLDEKGVTLFVHGIRIFIPETTPAEAIAQAAHDLARFVDIPPSQAPTQKG
jgi:hypothetical protein